MSKVPSEVQASCQRAADEIELNVDQFKRSRIQRDKGAAAFEQFIDESSAGWELRLRALNMVTDGMTLDRRLKVIARAQEFVTWLSFADASQDARS